MNLLPADDSCLGPNAIFYRNNFNRICDSTSEEEEDAASSEDSFRTARNQSADVFEFMIDVFKYVDDTTVVEAIDISNAKRHLTTGQPTAESKARFSELVAGAITERASEIGMKVNCAKTQLLLISPPNGYKNNAYISIQGQKIVSTEQLKLLGFMFGSQPNVSAHVSEIKRKFRARFWSLIHLRRAGIHSGELFKLFCVFIRPVIEFCSAVYHSMLTKEQSNDIERLQKQAVKLSFGWNKTYQCICEEQRITTLKKRRELYVDSFVRKTMRSARFGPTWFPVRGRDVYGLRERRDIEETNARTSRYYNGPLSYMRRRANLIDNDISILDDDYR